MVNVGKHTSPMDPMGYIFDVCFLFGGVGFLDFLDCFLLSRVWETSQAHLTFVCLFFFWGGKVGQPA